MFHLKFIIRQLLTDQFVSDDREAIQTLASARTRSRQALVTNNTLFTAHKTNVRISLPNQGDLRAAYRNGRRQTEKESVIEHAETTFDDHFKRTTVKLDFRPGTPFDDHIVIAYFIRHRYCYNQMYKEAGWQIQCNDQSNIVELVYELLSKAASNAEEASGKFDTSVFMNFLSNMLDPLGFDTFNPP